MNYTSKGIEALIETDYPYMDNEKCFRRLKDAKILCDNYGSYRIMYHGGTNEVFGGFQIVVDKNKNIVIGTNIFVREDKRRQGIAGELIRIAYKYFPNMVFSKNRNHMSIGMVEKYIKK